MVVMSVKRTPLQTALFRILTYGVALQGLLMIAGTLEDELQVHFTRHFVHASGLVLHLPILFGLTLLYLSTLLRRGKHTAWAICTALYAVILGFSTMRLILEHGDVRHPLLFLLRNVLVSGAVLAGLVLLRKQFTVRSDLRSFAFSLRFIVLVLAVALVYGVSGFLLLDKRDFHQNITLPQAVQRTVDQFNITTGSALAPHTRRAKFFLDSLSIISTGAVVYGAISLFQPIRARLYDQSRQRQLAAELLEKYPGSSEDYFKLWPHDKLFFFNLQHTAGIAYSVYRGVALVVGDPFGKHADYPQLLTAFEEFCRTNDWAAAFLHTEPQYLRLYKDADFNVQKIGEEAVVHIKHFDDNVRGTKYFRQVRNKFTKQGYTTELLTPPLSTDVVQRLHAISHEWLHQPGRTERRFIMGYFSPAYVQQNAVLVLKNAEGRIEAFMNQVHSYDPREANFDMLRHARSAPGNANDFLLMGYLDYAREQGFTRVNLGLCPLAGLEERDQERTVVDNALRFMYANGDRLYSFSGLYRFKAKYEPAWSGRYIAYRGGIRGFTRVINALNRAMKV
jgi:phosphatidylglycerol lysyltransferase